MQEEEKNIFARNASHIPRRWRHIIIMVNMPLPVFDEET